MRPLLLWALLIVAVGGALPARKMRYLQIIWRHGDRAPTELPYPLDNYTESYWPRGWGQLTNLGMRQMRELGVWVRETYKHYLNSTFHKNEVYVQSSNSDRALTSAQAFLNGLYPPSQDEEWQTDVRWQPIPVHSDSPNSDDPLLKPTSYDCPTYKQLAKSFNSESFAQMSQKYEILFAFLGEKTGLGSNATLKDIAGLNDIQREIDHDFRQPDWVFQRWPEYGNSTTLEIIMELKRVERIAEFNRPELSRLRGGFLLGDFIQRMHHVSKGKQKKPRKAMFYSSHDGTLQSLLYAMGVGDGRLVPYASAVIFELYEHLETGAYFVEVSYRRGEVLERLEFKGCSPKCRFSEFRKLMANTTVSEEDTLRDLCGLPPEKCDSSAASVSATFSLFPLLFGFIAGRL